MVCMYLRRDYRGGAVEDVAGGEKLVCPCILFTPVSCAQLLGDYRGNYYGNYCRSSGGWFGDNNIGADTGVTGESPPSISFSSLYEDTCFILPAVP